MRRIKTPRKVDADGGSIHDGSKRENINAWANFPVSPKNSRNFHDIGSLGFHTGVHPHRKKRFLCCCPVSSKKRQPCHYQQKPKPKTENVTELALELLGRHSRECRLELSSITSLKETKKAKPDEKFYKSMVNIFENSRSIIKALSKINEKCQDAMNTICYKPNPHYTLTDGKSIVGSYMWLIAFITKSARKDRTLMPKDFNDVRSNLGDIVGHSCVNWLGMVHIINAFVDCREKFNVILTKNIEPLSSSSEMDVNKRQNSKLVENTTQLRLYNNSGGKIETEDRLDDDALMVGYSKASVAFNANPEDIQGQLQQRRPSQVIVQDSTDKLTLGSSQDDTSQESGNWVLFQSTSSDVKIAAIKEMCMEVIKAFENLCKILAKIDSLLHTNFVGAGYLDAAGWHRKHCRGNSNKSDDIDNVHYFSYPIPEIKQEEKIICKSIMELCELLAEDFKIVVREGSGKSQYLNQALKQALVEMGRLVTGEMDITEYKLMELRNLIQESRHAVQVSYEYTRCFYLENLIKYKSVPYNMQKNADEERSLWDISCDCIKSTCLCSYSSVNLHFQQLLEYANIEPRTIFFMYRMSPYLQILQHVPVKVGKLWTMLKSADEFGSNSFISMPGFQKVPPYKINASEILNRIRTNSIEVKNK